MSASAVTAIAGLLLSFVSSTAVAAPSDDTYVSTEWTWLTDYIYWSADWSLNAEAGCELEVGLGVKLGNKTLGGTYRFTRHLNFTTRGFGAIHVRAVAGSAPCLVRLSQGNAEAVPLYGDPSVIKGVIRDGKVIYQKLENVVPVLPDPH